MTTPQDSPRRYKQKARRRKQLDAWRDRHETNAAASATPAPATAAKKTAK